MKSTPRKEWPIVSVGEVITLHYGKALERSKRSTTGSVPVYGANGVMDWSDHALTEGPSIIIGRKGSAGQLTRVDGPFWPSDVTYFTTHDQNALDFNFLHYTLQTLNLPSLARGVKPGINRNEVYDLSFPLPPLEEQQRIVAVLDEAFEGLARARAHAEANLQNARELYTSLLDEVFAHGDWPELELLELVNNNCSLSYGIVQPGDEVQNGLPIVRPVDLDGRIITLEGLKRIDPNRASSYVRTQLDGTDLLLCVRGTTGTISLSSEELAGANVTRGIVPIRFNQCIMRLFGYYQFQSGFLQRQIAEKTYGAALMQINIKDVKKLKLKCPPQEEQERAVERMEKISAAHAKLIASAEKKITDLDNLRRSLLQKAFASELT